MLKTLVAAVFVVLPCATAQSTDGRTIEALLAEVRQLRLALERSALLTPRVQLAVQRLSLQDQRVARLSGQLDTVRREIGNQTEGSQRAAQEAKMIEQQLSAESDASRRKALEDQLTHVKRAVTQGVDPQLQARESEIARALQYEQAVAQELSDRLTAIERALESPVPPATPVVR